VGPRGCQLPRRLACPVGLRASVRVGFSLAALPCRFRWFAWAVGAGDSGAANCRAGWRNRWDSGPPPGSARFFQVTTGRDAWCPEGARGTRSRQLLRELAGAGGTAPSTPGRGFRLGRGSAYCRVTAKSAGPASRTRLGARVGGPGPPIAAQAGTRVQEFAYARQAAARSRSAGAVGRRATCGCHPLVRSSRHGVADPLDDRLLSSLFSPGVWR